MFDEHGPGGRPDGNCARSKRLFVLRRYTDNAGVHRGELDRLTAKELVGFRTDLEPGQNVNYNKIVSLYYSNANGQSTPLNQIQLGYASSIANTNYEIWTSNTPDVNLDGIQKLLNITYQALDIGQTYVERLQLKVVPSGPAPTVSKPPVPYSTPAGFSSDITKWLRIRGGIQLPLVKKLMFNNIEVTDAVSGTVVAAQSYANPDYGYNWVRDTSLVMDVVATLYAAATNDVRSVYEGLFFRYAARRAAQQTDPGLLTGLGEPKFNLDGTPFTGPWGRPQNDGPASAAIAMMEFANTFLAQGGSMAKVRREIYGEKGNKAAAPLKDDLLFVARNWTSPSFDLWEEEESDHFYTRMVQHRALIMGAEFAKKMNDPTSAKTLRAAASGIAATLPQFYNPIRNLILYEYGPVLHGKYSYKDAAVLLGVIHGYAGDGIYSFSNDQILATAWQIATSFIPVYPIAATQKDSEGRVLGIPIGRYPEDVYDGVGTSRGNPWYLCTAAMAEVFYRASTEISEAGQIAVTNVSLPFWKYFAPQAKPKAGKTYKKDSKKFNSMIDGLHGWGDAFMRTIKYYTPDGGHLSEEIDRDSGKPVGAIDLTWSYASLQTAAFARAQAIGNKKFVRNLANLPTATNSSAPSS